MLPKDEVFELEVLAWIPRKPLPIKENAIGHFYTH